MKRDEKTKKGNLKLKEIEGIRFRVMWSTKALYSLLSLMIMMIIFISFNELIIYGRVSIDFFELAPIVFVLIPLMLLLAVINDKFLGTIVAVINEQGIYTKDGLIPWKGITEIYYKINIPASRSYDKFSRYCYLEICSHNKKYRILHAPHKMVRHIKKNVKDVKVKKDKEFIIIIALCLFIMMITSLINKLKK